MIYVCDFHAIHFLYFFQFRLFLKQISDFLKPDFFQAKSSDPFSRLSQAIFRLFLEQFSLNSYLAQVISQTTLNHSLEPVKTIKINPSVSTVTVSHTQALRDKFYALDFA